MFVKEKRTTRYVVLRWNGVLRFFRNMGWSKIGLKGVEIFGTGKGRGDAQRSGKDRCRMSEVRER